MGFKSMTLSSLAVLVDCFFYNTTSMFQGLPRPGEESLPNHTACFAQAFDYNSGHRTRC